MRRPGLLAMALTLSALLVTLSLGVWQLQRLAWKRDMMEPRRYLWRPGWTIRMIWRL